MTAYDPKRSAELCRDAKQQAAALRAEFPKCLCNGPAGCEKWCPCAPVAAAFSAASNWAEAHIADLANQLEAAGREAAHWKAVAFKLDDEKHRAQDEITRCSAIALENARKCDALAARVRELEAENKRTSAVVEAARKWRDNVATINGEYLGQTDDLSHECRLIAVIDDATREGARGPVWA